MTDSLRIRSAAGPIVGKIRPPGSKSITNRALVCAALADGTSTLRGALDSDDTRVMVEALRTLGLTVEHGLVLPEAARAVQQRVADALGTMCGVNVRSVDVNVEAVG